MIRDQANETRDELKKMVSWEAEIQKRDDQLIALAKEGKFGYKPPDTTRMGGETKAAPKPKKVEVKPADEPVQPEPARKTKAPMSYEDWGKLDAKLKQMELEGDEDEPKESALAHKEKGNEYFKKKNYALALKEYTAAQKLDPSNAVYFFNRATTFYQMSNFVECEKDATKAIGLDPRYTKAFIRRGLARDAQGKLELALQDFESADAIESGLSVVEKKLKEIREKLGISADGRIRREVNEPKVKIIDEESEPKVVEVESSPKIEVVEEVKKEPKIEVVEEHSMLEERQKNEPKIEVVGEHSMLEEKQVPGKVKIVAEDEEPKPTKVKIVAEEPKSTKVKIVAEEPKSEPVQPAAEESQPTKVKIVAEEPKPVEVPAQPPKVVDSKVDDSEAVDVAVGDTAKAGRGKRPENISVEVEGLDTPREEKPKKAAKGKAKGKKAKKPKAKNWGISWQDLRPDEYEARLKSLKPSELNDSLGIDWSGDVVVHILKTLRTGAFDPMTAFEFIEQLGNHEALGLYYNKTERLLGNPMVIEIIDASKAPPARKLAVREAWKLDE